jgi:hypothetical protein
VLCCRSWFGKSPCAPSLGKYDSGTTIVSWEGPIERPDKLGPSIARAIEPFKLGKPALVDAIVRRKHEK